MMINGAHVLLYSHNPDADRGFFRDVLDLKSVDAGGGWLIFALPPSEVAVHPTDDDEGDEGKVHGGRELLGAVLYFMCDDLEATIKQLAAKRVICTPVDKEPWGIRTTIPLPSGGEVGLYQPTHPTALKLSPG
jgi:catechol 2,3-dioxygenase-like lactoylglutathione lyase family enzyme